MAPQRSPLTRSLRALVDQNLRDLKQTMQPHRFTCPTVDDIHKKLVVHATACNLVRLAMLEAARRQGADVDRISFVDAMRWLINAEPGGGTAGVGRQSRDRKTRTGQENGDLALSLVRPWRRPRNE